MLNEQIMSVKYEDIMVRLARGQYGCFTMKQEKKAVLYIYDKENPKIIIGTVYTKKDIMLFWAMITELYELLENCPKVIMNNDLVISKDELKERFRSFYNEFIKDFKPKFILPGMFQFGTEKDIENAKNGSDILLLDNSSSGVGEVSFWLNNYQEKTFAMDLIIPNRWDRLHDLEVVFRYIDTDFGDKKVEKWKNIYRITNHHFTSYQLFYIFYLMQNTDRKWTEKIITEYFEYSRKYKIPEIFRR